MNMEKYSLNFENFRDWFAGNIQDDDIDIIGWTDCEDGFSGAPSDIAATEEAKTYSTDNRLFSLSVRDHGYIEDGKLVEHRSGSLTIKSKDTTFELTQYQAAEMVDVIARIMARQIGE